MPSFLILKKLIPYCFKVMLSEVESWIKYIHYLRCELATHNVKELIFSFVSFFLF